MAISRLPGYMTIQMVRFHFKQKEAVNAKVLKDIKFPVMLDMFDMCSKELQDKLRPARTEFKAYEDWLVDQVRSLTKYEHYQRVNVSFISGHESEGQEPN